MRARLVWLAAFAAFLAADAAAQTKKKPLDLTIPSVKNGTVAAVRDVGKRPAKGVPAPGGTQTVGSLSDLDQGPPVGAMVALPVGAGTSGKDTWKFGAAGTAEMQPWLAESAVEVVVTMEDGEQRTFRPRNPERFHIGQRVTVRSGELEPLGG